LTPLNRIGRSFKTLAAAAGYATGDPTNNSRTRRPANGSPGPRQAPLPVATRRTPGGYTIEACIPVAAVAGFTGAPGEAWHVELSYQNVHESSLTRWEGIVTLHP
jgi:hypothetical protein